MHMHSYTRYNLPILVSVVITHPSSWTGAEDASMPVARITGGTREEEVPANQITFTLCSVLNAYRGHASVVVARNPGISITVLTLSTVPAPLIDKACFVLTLTVFPGVSTCKEAATPLPPFSFTFSCRTRSSLGKPGDPLHVLTDAHRVSLIVFRDEALLVLTVRNIKRTHVRSVRVTTHKIITVFDFVLFV